MLVETRSLRKSHGSFRTREYEYLCVEAPHALLPESTSWREVILSVSDKRISPKSVRVERVRVGSVDLSGAWVAKRLHKMYVYIECIPTYYQFSKFLRKFMEKHNLKYVFVTLEERK
jgi:hypothetical protein